MANGSRPTRTLRTISGSAGQKDKKMNVQDSVFDLDTMERVTLVKPVPDHVAVTSVADALARLGNDAAKLLKVIDEGLAAEEKVAVKLNTSIPWMVEEESEDGKSTVLVPFDGKPADEVKVNGLILSFAKSMFGYAKKMDNDAEKSRAAKAKAKADAIEMIRSTPAIVERLKTSAAA